MRATLPSTFTAKAVGLSFAPGYPANLHHLLTDELSGHLHPSRLERDPDSPHDANAVRVLIDDEHIGHLPAWLAERIAPELDAGAPWGVASYEVLVANSNPQNPGLTVHLARGDGDG